MDESPKVEFGVAQVAFEVAIAAPQARVWRALVEETMAWWDRVFLMNPNARGFVVEPRLGGRVFEDWGDGAGVQWYHVIGVDPPNALMLTGQLTPTYGGPATTTVQLVLSQRGEATILSLSETAFGRVDVKVESFIRAAWEVLFETGLKSYVEAACARERS